MESLETQTAALCCEQCIKRKGCLWSIWEASGEKKGACYLSLLFNNTLANDSEGKKSTDSEAQKEAKGEEGVAMEKQASVCDRQEQEATFGFSGKNGEVRYVVSNGLCGVLVEQ